MSSCPWQALSPAVVVNDGSAVEVGPLPLVLVVVVVEGVAAAVVVVVPPSVVPVAVAVVVVPLALLQVNCSLCQEHRGARLLHCGQHHGELAILVLLEGVDRLFGCNTGLDTLGGWDNMFSSGSRQSWDQVS